jgi:hypothetical protein
MKVLGIIKRHGLSDITRQDARDIGVRVTQADYHGLTIEADMIAHNGAGSVIIDQDNQAVRIIIGGNKDGQKLEDRVSLLVGDRYLSVHDIRILLDTRSAVPA